MIAQLIKLEIENQGHPIQSMVFFFFPPHNDEYKEYRRTKKMKTLKKELGI
jgi:hypothetical protein